MVLFEWDEAKAAANVIKHGVLFETARRVFEDPCAVTEQDRDVDGELRWQTLGLVNESLILMVAHTIEIDPEFEEEVVRIISARKATKRERIHYDKNRA